MTGSSKQSPSPAIRDFPLEERQNGDSPRTTTSPGLGQQIVFRVRSGLLQTRRPARRQESQQSPPEEPVYRPRKTHRKSRAGCENCKKRKVKCDETRPGCQKCQTYGVPCSYNSLQVKPRKLQPESPAASMGESGNDVERVSTASPLPLPATYLSSRIDQALRLDSSMERDVHFALPVAKSTDAMVFHHFLNSAVTVTSVSESQRAVLAGDMTRIAFECPHLMHAVLGASASHLTRLVPSDRSYKLSEGYHWEKAIRLYRKELTTTIITPQNMDFLMSTCLLMSLAAFAGQDFSSVTSWVFSSDPTALNWLLIQCGLRHLLNYTSPWLDQSIWHEAFKESDNEYHTFNDKRPGAEGLHQGLAELCEIGSTTTTEETNLYHWPLRMLSPMLSLEYNSWSFAKMITFIGRLSPEYRDLLLQKDSRAMLILAYWLGKMCHHKQWWARSRVVSECTAICMYLENSKDPRILELLEYPALMCGYSLEHLQESVLLQSTTDALDSLYPKIATP